MRIAVGMSGGVDSSVAALLLKQAGHDVFGITMKIWDGGAVKSSGGNACYGPGEEHDIAKASEVCRVIGIEHKVYDCSEEYRKIVLEYFRNEYLAGNTPNPCIICNQKIKFSVLPEVARNTADFDFFATGHYARIEYSEEKKRYLLKKAADQKKDQTYFLHRLTQEQLAYSMFPLGSLTKEQVRKIASDFALPASEEPESQDFYEGDYRELLGVSPKKGEIVDIDGNILGTHDGFWNFTVGQRKGLGIAHHEPLYVIKIDAGKNRVIAGPLNKAASASFRVSEINWISIDKPETGMALSLKARSAQSPVLCMVQPLGADSVSVILSAPEHGIAAGQSAVFYDQDIVVGGGIISVD